MATRTLPPERVTATLNTAGDIAAEPGTQEWAIAVRLELLARIKNTESDARQLQRWARLMEEHQGYTQLLKRNGKPFASWREFCSTEPPYGLGYDPEMLRLVVEERLTAQERVVLAAIGTDGNVLPHATNRHTLERNISALETGTQADRAEQAGISDRTQRKLDYLARNEPELMTAVRERTLSADAAYRMARGKPQMASVPLEAEAAARVLVRRFTRDELTRLVALLAEQIAE